jgi:hypothetical protein
MKLWIARDYIFDDLYLFKNKPELDGDRWLAEDGMYSIDSNLFPEVTFYNSPQQVELKLVEI